MDNSYPGVFNWLTYANMISAIPKSWKLLLKNGGENTDTYIPKYKILEGKKISSKVYQQLVENETGCQKYMHRWNNMLQDKIELEEFKKAFSELYAITNTVKLRNFQYRLLLNKIFTNEILYEWKVVDTNTCTFCKKQPESITHLLVECTEVGPIWEGLKEFCKIHQLECTLTVKNIILNKINSSVTSVANTLALITKQYLYKQRCMKITPNINVLKNLFRQTYEMEKYNARINNKLDIHYRKWNKIFPQINEM